MDFRVGVLVGESDSWSISRERFSPNIHYAGKAADFAGRLGSLIELQIGAGVDRGSSIVAFSGRGWIRSGLLWTGRSTPHTSGFVGDVDVPVGIEVGGASSSGYFRGRKIFRGGLDPIGIASSVVVPISRHVDLRVLVSDSDTRSSSCSRERLSTNLYWVSAGSFVGFLIDWVLTHLCMGGTITREIFGAEHCPVSGSSDVPVRYHNIGIEVGESGSASTCRGSEMFLAEPSRYGGTSNVALRVEGPLGLQIRVEVSEGNSGCNFCGSVIFLEVGGATEVAIKSYIDLRVSALVGGSDSGSSARSSERFNPGVRQSLNAYDFAGRLEISMVLQIRTGVGCGNTSSDFCGREVFRAELRSVSSTSSVTVQIVSRMGL